MEKRTAKNQQKVIIRWTPAGRTFSTALLNLNKGIKIRAKTNEDFLCIVKNGAILLSTDNMTYWLNENMTFVVEAGTTFIIEVKTLPKKFDRDRAIIWLVKNRRE